LTSFSDNIHRLGRKAGNGLAFSGDLSGAAALGDRLRLPCPVMLEAGAPLFPLDSKPVLRYSRKMKDAKLIGLIAESVEATTLSSDERLSSVGVSWSESRNASYLYHRRRVIWMGMMLERR